MPGSLREYRICMPLTVEEYKVGQLYMINKHSHEQSEKGEGVEVVVNQEVSDQTHGKGFYTEKRIYLNSRLPTWLQSYIPRIFYVTEKAWNFYPYTETEYTCSFVPRFSISIKTCYKNDNGCTENSLSLGEEDVKSRDVHVLDIAYDELSEKYYKEEEDCRYFKSKKTGRGPLEEGWRDSVKPIMCSYKLVKVTFDVWGLRDRVQQYVQKGIREILLVGHRQAFAWIDNWYGMTYEEVRDYERIMQSKTNEKVVGDGEQSSEANKGP
ncbi:cytoplasmic phosphatidylinositol transfer protein 1-like [Rhopilema esculentum]|uniref:cytoplasmic phosphatidylinositol transfer protein 1-like n=1 Tax=Rhopilema esculentum TaxID=499914 RepID=UPI0031D69C60|eukprot:gene9328-17028_t